MRRLFPSIIALLMVAGTLSAQTTDNKSTETTKKNREPVGVNLSLWKNMSTQQTDTVGSTCFNLGLFSSMNRLNGVGINLLGSVIYRDMNGVQVTGLANLVGGSMRGVQIAGISNVNGDNLCGVSLSGLVGITGNHAQGVIFSGLTNIVGDNASGVLIGGLLNIAGENSSGAHIAGLANISGEDFIGEHFTGAQVAPFNFAGKGKGVQIGLVNYYKNSFDGFQLGLVNANPDTKVQLMLFGGNATKLNVGARFKNNLFYTILGGGTHYLDFSDKFSASLFYRAGLELPLYKQLFISGDLGFQHIENFKNKDYGFPARLYALQARVNLEYRLNDRLGVFVTGGYGGSRYYNKGVTYDKGVIVEGGVVLFKY